MNSKERVLAACSFRPPDAIPRVEHFWGYSESWEKRLGPVERVTDVVIWSPNEGAFPTKARKIKKEKGHIYEVDKWGRTVRSREGAFFVEILGVPITEGKDLDTVEFDSPDLDVRFIEVETETILDVPLINGTPSLSKVEKALQQAKQQGCVFGKTGGPYLRSTYVRGEMQFLTDIASDSGLAKAIADKMADHLMAVGVQEIERWSLQDTGIWIFDDIAYNTGPMISPISFERIFLPAYQRMIKAYKKAGARYVLFHSDGDIRLILDMLIDAGIDGINPVEPRANMKVVELRKCYPKLILAGGMDNSGILINGPIEEIQASTREIIDVARDGGVLIGSGSIGPDISLENYAAYHEVCMTYGNFGR
ncbi:MAG: uroporphyrinogen decarboxylase family protein [Chloroflexota bacterium]|nr:uroporphyrinogen decarboxylase family protein [Chloroflexota bacterium]